MVIRRCGNVAPAFATAARTRSTDWRTTASGSPTRRHPGSPLRHVGLDLDHRALDADQTHRPRAGQRHWNAARRWRRPAPGATADEHADHVEAQVGRVLVVGGQPALGQHAQPALLGGGDRLDRDAVAGARRVFTSQKTSASPLAGDDVELTLAAAPVAVEQRAARRR